MFGHGRHGGRRPGFGGPPPPGGRFGPPPPGGRFGPPPPPGGRYGPPPPPPPGGIYQTPGPYGPPPGCYGPPPPPNGYGPGAYGGRRYYSGTRQACCNIC